VFECRCCRRGGGGGGGGEEGRGSRLFSVISVIFVVLFYFLCYCFAG